MKRRRVANTTNEAFKNRNPWRNTPGPKYITATQHDLIRNLEAETGTKPRDLKKMPRLEAGDYITILLHRKNRT